MAQTLCLHFYRIFHNENDSFLFLIRILCITLDYYLIFSESHNQGNIIISSLK